VFFLPSVEGAIMGVVLVSGDPFLFCLVVSLSLMDGIRQNEIKQIDRQIDRSTNVHYTKRDKKGRKNTDPKRNDTKKIDRQTLKNKH
jgi:hypothetical protein